MILAPSTWARKELASVFPRISNTFDNQQLQTQTKPLLESITRASGEQIKTLAFRIEQKTRNAYANNAPDMRNAQMNEALVKALDQQLAGIALKQLQITNQLHWNHNFHSHNW